MDCKSSDPRVVEDWEEFFRDKSRRRADKERLRARRTRRRIIGAVVAASLFLLALVVVLGLTTA